MTLLGLHPLLEGTVYYGIVWLVLFLVLSFQNKTGKMSSDDTGIGHVVVSISVFSMWLFWLCAWLHQWHPLIKPIYEGGDDE
mmetsp:Transcript_19450/g.22249  ORF Transcript_19450/g.22249 Transcript_19450/m.22249 type:complete len:82 (-) Transcript_19450:159-404(-)|eukprot:CAMPEP_0194139004 /NCGR_PEP_ID=MMETSP0152-20130528/8755_1 /TAXON_ID=1049557 /ORGANISM="Thalassiothrix antarctica, Strain L6-D1" /LENGTH=81 /DNA_ID=CAMNT_0038836701 /DNA_START=83 /DNA_END=328 /DNA_ORIENTATION=+